MEEDETFEDEEAPITPTVDDDDAKVSLRPIDYSSRGPNDVMLSGPIKNGWGPGRPFRYLSEAVAWADAKYGQGRVFIPERQSKGRWALLIKNLKVQHASQ